ncbi:Metaxin-3, partial [Nowakowskiella sp. JEL0078]
YVSLIEDKLYDALLFNWWLESDNYNNSTRPTYAKNLPWISRYTVPSKLREKVKFRLSKYKLLKFNDKAVPELWRRAVLKKDESVSEVYLDARKIYHVLEIKLGEKKYMFGDKPSTLDAIMYGHLALHSSFKSSPRLFGILALEFPLLSSYLKVIRQQLFPNSIELPLTPSTLITMQTQILSILRNQKEAILGVARFTSREAGILVDAVIDKIKGSKGSKANISNEERERIEKIYRTRIDMLKNVASVFGAVGFFLGFIVHKQIVEISVNDEEEEE